MSQLSLMPAHVPAHKPKALLIEDVPLPLALADTKTAADCRVHGISSITRAVCSDEDAKAGLARFLKRKHRFENVAKGVCRDTGCDLRTVQNWLAERNLPDDDGRRRLVSAYGEGVLRIIYQGADPDVEAPL